MSPSARPRAALAAAALTAVSVLGLVEAPAGVASPTTAAAPPGGSITPVPPLRVLDTRSGGIGLRTGLVRPGGALPVPIADVDALLVNITVVDAETAGWIRVGSGDGTSNGNFVARAPSATLALVPLEHSGSDQNGFRFLTSTPAQVLVDVEGYVTTTAAATDSTFTPVGARRIADSRTSTALRTFGAQQTQTLDVRTRAGLPANATAVVANVTLVKATAQTYLTAWSGRGSRPTASTLNVSTGGTVANRAVLPLDSAGRVSLFNYAGRADVLVDVVGYLAPDAAGSYYVPAPVAHRIADHAGESVTLTPDLPGSSDLTTTAVWVSLAAAATSPGYLVSGPTVTLPSRTSDLNLVAGRAVANSGPVALTPGNSFQVVSAPSSRFVVDLDGWFQKRG